MCVTDIALAPIDVNKIYIIADGVVERSDDNGRTFTAIAGPNLHTPPLKNIAVAPDDPNVSMVSDSRINANQVWISLNGGNNWTNYGIPVSGDCIITDVAIAPMTNGQRRFFCTTAANLGNSTSLGRVAMKSGSTWSFFDPVSGSHDYIAIQVSPNFSSDYTICVIGGKAAGGVDYQLLNLNTLQITQTVPLTPNIKDYRSTVGSPYILAADIALDHNFYGGDESTRISYVSLAKQNDGYVYRIVNDIAANLISGIPMKSVALLANNLVVGGYDSSKVYMRNQPINNSDPAWILCHLPPGERKTMVRTEYPVGNIIHVGTSGRNGGIF